MGDHRQRLADFLAACPEPHQRLDVKRDAAVAAGLDHDAQRDELLGLFVQSSVRLGGAAHLVEAGECFRDLFLKHAEARDGVVHEIRPTHPVFPLVLDYRRSSDPIFRSSQRTKKLMISTSTRYSRISSE